MTDSLSPHSKDALLPDGSARDEGVSAPASAAYASQNVASGISRPSHAEGVKHEPASSQHSMLASSPSSRGLQNSHSSSARGQGEMAPLSRGSSKASYAGMSGRNGTPRASSSSRSLSAKHAHFQADSDSDHDDAEGSDAYGSLFKDDLAGTRGRDRKTLWKKVSWVLSFVCCVAARL